MKNCAKSCVLVLAILFANALYAADQIYNRKIIKIATYATFAIVYYAPNFSGTQDCGTGDNNSGVIRFDSAEKKEMYSAALAAATSNNEKVGFGINGCDNNLGRPIIYRIEATY